MREIKFRAWDNVANEMIYAGENSDVIFVLGSSGIECTDIRNVSPTGDGVDYMDHLIYMQFTGLHDRNGKEIFEEDVFKDEEGIAKVSFENGQYIAMYQSLSGKWIPYGSLSKYIADHNGEVIGNIYENPKLLEN